MAPRRSRLRVELDYIVADGEPHTVEELSGRINGLAILPGAAAREAERQRRRQTPELVERSRSVSTDRLIAIGRRSIIRDALEKMVRDGAVDRIAPATYQRKACCPDSDQHADPELGGSSCLA